VCELGFLIYTQLKAKERNEFNNDTVGVELSTCVPKWAESMKYGQALP
jgi:hypothetical protein